MFKPSINQEINLFNNKYIFQARKPNKLYASQGAKGTVYRLQRNDKQLFAFKVFHKQFCSKELSNSVTNLKKIAHFVGLKAADREILSQSEPIVQIHKDLEYSIIMPWITTSTWFEVLTSCSQGKVTLSQEAAFKLCQHFLEVMMNLEKHHIAHTDMCSRNIMVDINKLAIQLIDLEDIYMPNINLPQEGASIGGDGYFHPKRENLWCRQGDRYATAIIAVEMLLLSNQNFRQSMQGEGFFHKNNQERLEEKFPEVEYWLKQFYPDFAKKFTQAWKSDNLLECPTINELYESLLKKQKIDDFDDPFDDPYLSGPLASISPPKKLQPQPQKPKINIAVNSADDPFNAPDVTGSLTSKPVQNNQTPEVQIPNRVPNNYDSANLIATIITVIIVLVIIILVIMYITPR